MSQTVGPFQKYQILTAEQLNRLFADVVSAISGSIGSLPLITSVAGDDFAVVVEDGLGKRITVDSLFSNRSLFGTTRLGNEQTNYVSVVGASAGVYPKLSVAGSDALIDLRVAPKGAGYLSSPKLFIGSDAVRASIDTASVVYLRASTTVSGTGAPPFFVGGIFSGTPVSTGINLHQFQASETIIGPVTGMTYLHEMNEGASGGRTAFSARLALNGRPATTASTYLVGGAFTARGFAPYNGIPGNHIGSLFGSNIITMLYPGAASEWASVVGLEVDTGIPTGTGAEFHIGISSILHWDNGPSHNVRGSIQDTAFMIGSARNDRATVGWRLGYSYGDPVGWVFNDDSRIIGMQPVIEAFSSYARPYTAGDGFEAIDVTFKRSVLISPRASIDLNGNVGGQTTAGVRLQARDSVLAKSAAVTSLTPLQPDGGGMYISSNIPTITFDPPAAGFSGSTSATGTIARHAAAFGLSSIGNNGTNYVPGDVLTMVGGTSTQAAQITVTDVIAGGLIRSAYVSRGGDYTVLPPSPTTWTGGSGTGFTGMTSWTALSYTITSGGSGYAEYPAPIARYNWGGGPGGRQLVAIVTMTATQRQLQLNNGKINVAGIPTSAAGLVAGDVWSNAGVLTVV